MSGAQSGAFAGDGSFFTYDWSTGVWSENGKAPTATTLDYSRDNVRGIQSGVFAGLEPC